MKSKQGELACTGMVNLTQHVAMPDQGCFELKGAARTALTKALTFRTLAEAQGTMVERAAKIAALARASGATSAMIGGAMWFMPQLCVALKGVGVTPYYAFSVRQSVDQAAPNGAVIKAVVFKHLGFVAA